MPCDALSRAFIERMTSRAVREKLGGELGLWLTEGWIDRELAGTLQRRYASRGLAVRQLITYLAFCGGLSVACGLFGLIGVLADSRAVTVILLSFFAAGLLALGIRLGRDALGQYVQSSRVIFTLGVIAAVSALTLGFEALRVRDEALPTVVCLVAVPALVVCAYWLQNGFALVLALLAFFHGVGSSTWMYGRSTYVFDAQEPRLLIGAALLVVLVGVAHERRLRARTQRLYVAYESVGLLYLNLSLLILSIAPPTEDQQPVWIAAFTLVALAQIVIGARLKNGIFTGFGVTFLAIDLFTRYHEHFWSRLAAGVYFLAGGAALLVAGLGCELILRRVRDLAPSESDPLGRRIHAELDRLCALGLLSDVQRARIAERYPATRWDVVSLVRWLTIFGAVGASIGLVVLAREVMNAVRIAELALFVLTIGFLVLGRWVGKKKGLARTAHALELSSGICFVGLSWAVAIDVSSGSGRWPLVLGIDAAILLVAAYVLGNRLVLVLACIHAFAFLGAQTGYASGWGMYWLGMAYPARYLVAGALVLAIAWLHVRHLRGTRAGFSRVYLHFGLLSIHLALWFFALFGYRLEWDASGVERALFTIAWLIACGACIGAGIKLEQRALRAHGIVFLLIAAYTTYFQFIARESGEIWWLHLLLTGASLVALGFFAERRLRTREPVPQVDLPPEPTEDPAAADDGKSDLLAPPESLDEPAPVDDAKSDAPPLENVALADEAPRDAPAPEPLVDAEPDGET